MKENTSTKGGDGQLADMEKKRTTNNISKMPFEIRYRNYKQEEAKLLLETKNIPVGELSEMLRKLADKWKV